MKYSPRPPIEICRPSSSQYASCSTPKSINLMPFIQDLANSTNKKYYLHSATRFWEQSSPSSQPHNFSVSETRSPRESEVYYQKELHISTLSSITWLSLISLSAKSIWKQSKVWVWLFSQASSSTVGLKSQVWGRTGSLVKEKYSYQGISIGKIHLTCRKIIHEQPM